MTNEKIRGSGTDYYKHMDSAAYEHRINSPAKSIEYFEQFHRPLAERAKGRFGAPIHLLDIACGPANELDFFKGDPNVIPIATDISAKVLQEARDKVGGKGVVFVSDASLPAVKENSVEAGVLVNAMVYVPDKMLNAMYGALKPGGECVTNFRLFKNVRNTSRGATLQRRIVDRQLTVEKHDMVRTFDVKVIDHSERIKDDGTPDLEMRQLGQQIFFEKESDIEELIKIIGFEIIEHSAFHFASPSYQDNEIEVYTLRKP